MYLNQNNGFGNVCIGYNCGRYGNPTTGVGYHYQIIIGYEATTAATSAIRIGGSYHTTWAFATNCLLSDQRDKYDIQDTLLGLNFLNKLKVKDYRYDFREDYEKYNDDGTPIEPVYDGRFKKKRRHTGLIAQELKSTLQEIGIDHSMYCEMNYNDVNNGIPNTKDICGIRYEELIGVVIKSVQELSTENQQQQNEINTLKTENTELKSVIDKLKTANSFEDFKNSL